MNALELLVPNPPPAHGLKFDCVPEASFGNPRASHYGEYKQFCSLQRPALHEARGELCPNGCLGNDCP